MIHIFRKKKPLLPGAVLLISDLHEDFVGAGPMAASNSENIAEKLIELYKLLEDNLKKGKFFHDTEYRNGKILVEGRQWGEHSPGTATNLPRHCIDFPTFHIPYGLQIAPSNCYIWETCPQGGGNILEAVADGKGNLFSLEEIFTKYPPNEIHVAGLSVEHSALALCKALELRFGSLGVKIKFRADLSTFLNPSNKPGEIQALQEANVEVIGN